MTGNHLVRKVRALAGRNGLEVKLTNRGKGSHKTLYYGDRKTILPDPRRELKPGTLRGICTQLGINPRELD